MPLHLHLLLALCPVAAYGRSNHSALVFLTPSPPAPAATRPQAKIIAQEYSAVTGAVGTLAWSSPEMLLGARCTERSDIYSYGERVGCIRLCRCVCSAGRRATSAAC